MNPSESNRSSILTRTVADEARLQAVRTFADNVLTKGQDHFSGQNTPLFIDGIHLDSADPVQWIFQDQRFTISNLASQQNLFRTLDLLTRFCGVHKYRQAAEEAFRYHFDHLASDCGLLRWGGHQFVDLITLQPVGRFDADRHEFKFSFPYYELMWKVNPEATKKFIRAFWNAHVLNWGNLDMNRHGAYDQPMGKLWASTYQNPEPFFEGQGLTFINCGTDLIYAGAMLHQLGGEEGALEWSQRLAHQYVRARHPETGLGVYQYSKPRRQQQPPAVMTESRHTNSSYGDRAGNQFSQEFGEVAREGYAIFSGESIYGTNALVQLHLAEYLGTKGANFLEWTIDGLKAYMKYGYMPQTNQFRPMWADGTDLTGFIFPRFGYYGPAGKTLSPSPASLSIWLSYARAFRLTSDPEIWQMVRSIAKGYDLGDIGEKPMNEPSLNLDSTEANPLAIFAVLEIYRAIPHPLYLDLARQLADNIIQQRFHQGFFLPSEKRIHASFNEVDPLAILAVEAALQNQLAELPPYLASRGYIHGRYDGYGRTTDNHAIYSVTE
jgi:pectate lyase